MLIDWFTVGAQALNFIILVWLMKRFLYQPVLDAIDAREKRIAAQIADAVAKQAEAKQEREEFRHKNEDFDRQRADLLAKAAEQARIEGTRLLDETRKAADAMSAKRQETLRNDAKNLNQAITRRMQTEVFAIARRTLTDLASVNLEERVGEVFTRRLREMEGDAKARFAQAINGGSDPGLVRSAFELPETQRAAIRQAINETLSADVPLKFETTPDLVSGIEFTANGQKVAWSIADYLGSLEKGVGELLKNRSRPMPEAKPKAKSESGSKPVAGVVAKSETEVETEPVA